MNQYQHLEKLIVSITGSKLIRNRLISKNDYRCIFDLIYFTSLYFSYHAHEYYETSTRYQVVLYRNRKQEKENERICAVFFHYVAWSLGISHLTIKYIVSFNELVQRTHGIKSIYASKKKR